MAMYCTQSQGNIDKTNDYRVIKDKINKQAMGIARNERDCWGCKPQIA